jgi:surface-anchored protein
MYLSSTLAPAGSRAMRPSGAAWDFLGVGAGESIWLISQTQSATPNTVWLGLNTESTSASSLQSWDPLHAAVGAGKWMELRLLDVAYYGEGTSNHLSLWINGSFGTPNVWMDTYDGISTTGEDDVYYMAPGGHSHMNWAFTSEGIYDVTFQARTFLADGTESTSDAFTVRFGVNATEVVPEPGRSLLLVVGLSAMIIRRHRVRPPCVAPPFPG